MWRVCHQVKRSLGTDGRLERKRTANNQAKKAVQKREEKRRKSETEEATNPAETRPAARKTK